MYSDFVKFLKEVRANENDPITHLAYEGVFGGKFNIKNNKLDELYNLIKCNVLDYKFKDNFTLVEKVSPFFKFYIDLDITFTTNFIQQLKKNEEENDIEPLNKKKKIENQEKKENLKLLNKSDTTLANDFFLCFTQLILSIFYNYIWVESNFVFKSENFKECLIFKTPIRNKDIHSFKLGYHFYFPEIIVDKKLALLFRKLFLDIWNEKDKYKIFQFYHNIHSIFNENFSMMNVFDGDVYINGSLRMPFNFKRKMCPPNKHNKEYCQDCDMFNSTIGYIAEEKSIYFPIACVTKEGLFIIKKSTLKNEEYNKTKKYHDGDRYFWNISQILKTSQIRTNEKEPNLTLINQNLKKLLDDVVVYHNQCKYINKNINDLNLTSIIHECISKIHHSYSNLTIKSIKKAETHLLITVNSEKNVYCALGEKTHCSSKIFFYIFPDKVEQKCHKNSCKSNSAHSNNIFYFIEPIQLFSQNDYQKIIEKYEQYKNNS